MIAVKVDVTQEPSGDVKCVIVYEGRTVTITYAKDDVKVDIPDPA